MRAFSEKKFIGNSLQFTKGFKCLRLAKCSSYIKSLLCRVRIKIVETNFTKISKATSGGKLTNEIGSQTS